MKKINQIIASVIAFYTLILLAVCLLFGQQTEEKNREYLVKVNRIMYGMEMQGGFFIPDLPEGIDTVSFLENESREDIRKTEEFFRKRNGYETHIEPLMTEGGVMGLVRFDYKNKEEIKQIFWLAEGLILLSGLFILAVLFYVRNQLIKPFSILGDMPYELAKGHLNAEIEENNSRFFGKFVWGIAMLRDNLRASQMKALQLEKEKKMLILSVSHDIKTPLNSIKLYARAFREGMYDTLEKQAKAGESIEELAGEIESFVQRIVNTSSREIVPVEVENTEFYLREFMEMVRKNYEPKCRLVMTEFIVDSYDDKLLKGNRDSAFEAVENVLENAFKYGDGKRIEISFYEEEYCQLVKIKNSGQPVKAGEMPHLFDSFYRGSNAGGKEGNGLGLYICREIMHKMEGEIFAQREDDGMSFHLVFQVCG